MVCYTGFLVANDVTLNSGNGVAMFLVTGTVLDVEDEALRVMLQVDSAVVGRRSKSTVGSVWSGVGRSAWGAGFRAGRFRKDGGPGFGSIPCLMSSSLGRRTERRKVHAVQRGMCKRRW